MSVIGSTAHRRANEQLFDYWQELKADHALPMEVEVNPDAVKDIWDSCFVILHDPEDAKQPFRYMYLGQALIDAYGDDVSDKEVCEKLAYPLNPTLQKQFESVVANKQPETIDAEFTNAKGLVIKYRTCLLPLAKDNRNAVGYIMGAMKWKAF